MSSDHSTSHTQTVTGPSLPIVQVDSLRLGMDSGLPSHRATPGASTDDGPNQLATPQPSAGGQSHSLHSHLVTEELSTGGPFLSEPSLEPEADAVTSLDLSQLRDPSLGDQPQSLVDHLPSEPTGLRRSTRSRIMTSRMRESISQQPSRKRRRIRSSVTTFASPSWAGGTDQPTASTADEPVTDSEQQIVTQDIETEDAMTQAREDHLIETEEDAMGLF